MKSVIESIRTSISRFGGDTEEAAAEPAFSVLFVCMGNICRSPTAEGVFRKLAAEQLGDYLLRIDSAGTHAYHLGEPPDARAQRAALERGIDISALRARRVEPEDFERFDLILAMDRLNHVTLLDACPEELADRVRMFLEFAPHRDRADVPDPYYGGRNGFEFVLDLAEEASTGLLEHVRRQARQR